MKDIYKCQTCGVVAKAEQQLCAPAPVAGKSDYCGHGVKREQLCPDMRQQVPFVCSQCGRAAEQAELLCNPLVVG